MLRKLIYLFCLILAPGPVLTKAAEGTDPCLVGWWKFDESSGTTVYDSSGNGFDGTLVGGATWTEGRIGGGIELDGSSGYVSIPDFELTTNTITFAIWLNGWKGGDWAPLISSRVMGRCEMNFGNNDTLHYTWNNDSSATWGWTGGPVIPEDTWTMLAVTIDPDKAVAYVYTDDGGLIQSTNAIAHIEGTVGALQIGYSYGHRYVRGILDEVRLYSRALTETEVAVIYTGGTIDERIARNPDKVLKEANEDLQRFGDWCTNPKVKKEYSTEISEMLLIIGKAKEANGTPSEEILKDYYKLTTQFPNSPQAIEALCGIVILDEQNGLEYALNFLEKFGSASRIIAFYEGIIKSLMIKSDYTNVDKYVKLFMDNYASSQKGPKLMAKIMSSLGRVPRREQLYEIIERRVSQDPNSVIRCGLFRQRAMALTGDENFNRFLEKAESARRKFPGTRLAKCASAILADNQYQQGNFVSAIKVFKPELFAEHLSESAIIEDISSLVVLYNVNTLRPQGINLGKVYESLAKYCYSLNRNATSVFCYRQSAKAKGFSLDAFERAASKVAKYCNTTAENEIWFWKGLFAAEDGDLMAAGLLYEKFLKTDATSILAARAYYDTAHARMVLGQYSEAREAIAEVKRISPCESVIQLEWEIADAAASLRRSREGSTKTKM